ncbi:regulator [Photobacterium alginatilyticum]|uniref:Regulator n=1 Tax=Photobacterium alginatilyticum TaxID=1775171 RepID=A0ABW9YPR7_9GAMM|nr:regulator [Photobacterium alginatilyticum]NBI55481.1 regulator [Photobacterium alginatilyticum]
MRNTHELTENYIFRFFRCGLSIEDTAKLCFKSVRTVTSWDEGKPIPPECRRLMRMYCGLELDPLADEWRGWSIRKGLLITPNRWSLTPNRIITGNALIEIGAEPDRKNLSQIIKVARLISR